MASFQAVVFDLDGTLTDTEKLHNRYWIQAGKSMGVDITYEDALYLRSLEFPLSQEYFRAKFGPDFDLTPIRIERRRLVKEHVDRYGIEPKPYAIETLEYLRSKGIRTAVATSNTMGDMERFLKMIGADRLLDEHICASMVKRGKPAPDIYIHASEVLGVDPKQCIAVEDSPNGVRSAYQAGFNVVFVPDLTPSDDEIDSMAYAVCPSLLGLKDLV